MLRLIQFSHNEYAFVKEGNLTKPIEIGPLRETVFAAKEDARWAVVEAGYWFDVVNDCAREH